LNFDVVVVAAVLAGVVWATHDYWKNRPKNLLVILAIFLVPGLLIEFVTP